MPPHDTISASTITPAKAARSDVARLGAAAHWGWGLRRSRRDPRAPRPTRAETRVAPAAGKLPRRFAHGILIRECGFGGCDDGARFLARYRSGRCYGCVG